jgi:hypothetical protein
MSKKIGKRYTEQQQKELGRCFIDAILEGKPKKASAAALGVSSDSLHRFAYKFWKQEALQTFPEFNFSLFDNRKRANTRVIKKQMPKLEATNTQDFIANLKPQRITKMSAEMITPTTGNRPITALLLHGDVASVTQALESFKKQLTD